MLISFNSSPGFCWQFIFIALCHNYLIKANGINWLKTLAWCLVVIGVFMVCCFVRLQLLWCSLRVCHKCYSQHLTPFLHPQVPIIQFYFLPYLKYEQIFRNRTPQFYLRWLCCAFLILPPMLLNSPLCS